MPMLEGKLLSERRRREPGAGGGIELGSEMIGQLEKCVQERSANRGPIAGRLAAEETLLLVEQLAGWVTNRLALEVAVEADDGGVVERGEIGRGAFHQHGEVMGGGGQSQRTQEGAYQECLKLLAESGGRR